MTSRSAAVYGVGGALLVACLAAANMPQDRDAVHDRLPRPSSAPSPDALALDVRSQAARLHTLIARAPTPGAGPRNPFAFAARARAAAAPAIVHAAVADDPAPLVAPALPALTLMGVAEETTGTGPRRTA